MMVQVNMAQQQENKQAIESEEERLRRLGGAGAGKKKSQTTTLTIVQDFPKKRAGQMEQMSQVNLVQDNSNTLNETTAQGQLATESKADDKNITLIIGQEFPKKSSSESHNVAGNVEMVQGQEQNTRFHFQRGRKNDNQKKTTLTIVQDFPKKKVGEQAAVSQVNVL